MWPKDLLAVTSLQFGGQWHNPAPGTLSVHGGAVAFEEEISPGHVVTTRDEHVTGVMVSTRVLAKIDREEAQRVSRASAAPKPKGAK